jgi:hypothetical protein
MRNFVRHDGIKAVASSQIKKLPSEVRNSFRNYKNTAKTCHLSFYNLLSPRFVSTTIMIKTYSIFGVLWV